MEMTEEKTGKRIWLVNQYAMPPRLESRLRTIKFAHYLQKAGYEVTIFASSIMHNMDIDLIEDDSLYIERQYGDLNFVHIKTAKYKGNGLKRVIGLIQFPRRFLKIAEKFPAPDCIIQTATVPFGNIIYRYARKVKAKYIVEVLDLWPETFVDLGILNKKNPIVPLLYKFEKWLYTKADQVVFSMEGGRDYIIDKKWDTDHGGPIDLKKVFYINNGVDLADFNHFKEQFKLQDASLEDESVKKVIYLGSIRLANNLKKLIDAAALLKEHKDVVFFLYGDGDDRKELEKYCKEQHIDNVVFKEKWIDPQYVPYVLSKATVNILNYMPGNFGKYGGSQSKMFQYMASGRPICSNLKMMYCLINKYKLGIAREFDSSQEYAEAILKLLDLEPDEYNAICKRAREAAIEFDYKNLTDKLIALL